MGRIKLGGIVLGAAKRAINQSVSYANERKQFGSLISSFGSIKHKLAEQVIRTFTNESAVYRTSGNIEEVVKANLEAGLEKGKAEIEGIAKFSVECAMLKVYGSEALDFVVDEAVQIYGGMGYSAEAPVDRAYRDSRINRIWEGTNEINRMLIVDTLMRAAMKGELPLLQVIQQAAQDLLTFRPEMTEPEGTLEKEKKLVAMAKKIALLAAGAAVQKYMEKLGNQQEVIAMISDIIIEIFAMESALLRTLKKAQKEGEEKSEIQIAVTRVYVNDAFAKIEFLAKQIFASLAEGEELRTQLMALKRLARNTPINTVVLRRKIADSVIPLARYHLTKM